jgi:hypothetical protein
MGDGPDDASDTFQKQSNFAAAMGLSGACKNEFTIR